MKTEEEIKSLIAVYDERRRSDAFGYVVLMRLSSLDAAAKRMENYIIDTATVSALKMVLE